MEMSEAAKQVKREYQREYMRKWRQKEENKERVRRAQIEYWERKAREKEAEQSK